MKDKEKKSFVLYYDIRGPLKMLTEAQQGKLFMAILDYAESGIVPEFDDPGLDMAFAFIRNSIDRDTATWESKRQARAEAGSKGGKQTAANRANAAFAEQKEHMAANQAVPVPVLAPDPAPVPVTVNVNEDIADKPPKKRFIPPTVEDVTAYCTEHGYGIDAVKFVSHYTSQGWMVGKNHMKDWHAAVRTWERNNFDGKKRNNADSGRNIPDDSIPGITKL